MRKYSPIPDLIANRRLIVQAVATGLVCQCYQVFFIGNQAPKGKVVDTSHTGEAINRSDA